MQRTACYEPPQSKSASGPKLPVLQSGGGSDGEPRFIGLLGLLFVGLLCAAAPLEAKQPVSVGADSWIENNIERMTGLYRDLHAAPELSYEEAKTAERVARELRDAGLQVTTGVGGHGVVGVLKNGPGKTLLLRCDMDALPVVEETGLEYASRVKTEDNHGAVVGVMHACGHDIHMTSIVGAAHWLADHRQAWSGTLVAIGQPAEERGAGARAMLEDGLFVKFPRPDFALALHVAHDIEVGAVGCRAGYQQANVDSVDIEVRGRGGHGAYPETTVDPIVVAAKLVLDLQTIASREVRPIDPVVVTVGSIHGGTKHNVIGDTCTLQITVRTYSQEVRRQVHDSIRRKAAAAATSAGAPEPLVEISEGTPSMYNDPALTERVQGALVRALGADHVQEAEPSMGGEDFARYGEAGCPICMFKLGSVSRQRLEEFKSRGEIPPSLHSSKYYPDPEPTLRCGVRAMTAAALELLPAETK